MSVLLRPFWVSKCNLSFTFLSTAAVESAKNAPSIQDADGKRFQVAANLTSSASRRRHRHVYRIGIISLFYSRELVVVS